MRAQAGGGVLLVCVFECVNRTVDRTGTGANYCRVENGVRVCWTEISL